MHSLLFCGEKNQRRMWHCHSNDGTFLSIITTCRFSNIDFISPISGAIVPCVSAWLVQRLLMQSTLK